MYQLSRWLLSRRSVRLYNLEYLLLTLLYIGKECNDAHPKFELPAPTDVDPKMGKKVIITCHYCGEVGHKVNNDNHQENDDNDDDDDCL